MSEQDLKKNVAGQPSDEKEPTILRNEIGEAIDPTVVIDEADRTVMLTENETIIIEKQPRIDITPKNRPRKVYGGMWGPVEIGVLGAGMLAVLSAVLLYSFFVVPSNRELEASRARVERLESELSSARGKYGDLANDENRVARLISSVNDFESRYLPIPTIGRTALYQRLNGLIAAYGLVNSSGPDYAPLEILDKSNGSGGDDNRGKAKYRSFFPGVYATMTVEGPYVNLRRFIREIETGSEFIVISSVQLEPSDSQGEPGQANPTVASGGDPGPGRDLTTMYPAGSNVSVSGDQFSQSGQPSSSRGKTHGSIVSLRIEMAAYFRRPTTLVVETASVIQ